MVLSRPRVRAARRQRRRLGWLAALLLLGAALLAPVLPTAPGEAPGEPGGGSLGGWLLERALLPALPDRARLREVAAAVAGAALGRPLRIEGGVTLSLLPEPTLGATAVLLPDGGDGVSLHARMLRLRLALLPLLAGRVEPREVVLEGAALRLPWPLPPAPSGVRGLSGLLVRVEDGSLSVGALRAEAVEGTLSAGAAAGGPGTLAAAGTLRLGGLGWRASARLGAPDGSGAASLAVSLDGREAARDNGVRFAGALAADGTVSGELEGGGPDLSRLLPAPALAWHASGPLSLARRQLGASTLLLTLGGAPVRAAAALQLGAAPRLDVSLDLSRLDLDAWLPPLLGAGAPFLPVGLDLLAEGATAGGATLRDLRLSLELDGAGLLLRHGSAVLPGEAGLRLSGRLDRAAAFGGAASGATVPRAATVGAAREGAVPGTGAGATATGAPAAAPWRFAGEAALLAADVRPLRRWVTPLAPGLAGLLPADAVRAVDVRAAVAAAPGVVALTGLTGRLDGATLSGGLALRLPVAPAVPGITAELQLRGLTLDPFLVAPSGMGALPGTDAGGQGAGSGSGWPGAGPWAAAALREAGRRLGAVEGTLRLDLPEARWRGRPVEGLSAEASLGPRLVLRRLQGFVDGARLAATGTLGTDGTLGAARVELSGPDAAALLPAGLRRDLPGGAADAAWHGPVAAVLEANGPPAALSVRLRAELDDGRLELAPVLDLPAGRGEGTVTLRHPGARRLLGLLGLEGPAWLGEGSLALVTRAAVAPGRVALDGLDLVAGALRARGALRLELRPEGGRPGGWLGAWPGGWPGGRLGGELRAEVLPVPVPDPLDAAPLRLAVPAGWEASVALTAARVEAGGVPVLHDAAATLAANGGGVRLDGLTATLAGGRLEGEAVLALPPPDAAAAGGGVPGSGAAGAPPGVRAGEPGDAAGRGMPVLTLRGTLRGATGGDGSVLPVAGGRLDADLALSATGHAPAAMLATLSGTATLRVTDGALLGVDLPALAAGLRAGGAAGAAPDAASVTGVGATPGPEASAPVADGVRAALMGGRTPFGRLELTGGLADGVLTLRSGLLEAPSGRIEASGELDLPEGRADLRLLLRPAGSGLPAVGLRVAGPPEAATRTPELAAVTAWLAAGGVGTER